MYWKVFETDEKVTQAQAVDRLGHLLEVANSGYFRHIEWFIQHRNTTIKQLATLVASELVLMRFYKELEIPQLIMIVFFFGLAALGVTMAYSGAASCKRSFGHGMRSLACLNKCLWALAPNGYVPIFEEVSPNTIPPMHKDPTIQVPKYVEDSASANYTEDFMEEKINIKTRNTLFWAYVSILIMAIITSGLGIGLGVALVQGH